MLAVAADTGNSDPLCPLWWLMDVRCYIIALLTQWVILSKINSKVQILKTNLNTYNTCQKTRTHTHTHEKKQKTKKTYPQHILQTHRTHINIFKNPPCHFLHRMVGAGVPITYHSVEHGSLKWGRALVICGFYLVLSFLFWRHDHLWAPRQTIL